MFHVNIMQKYNTDKVFMIIREIIKKHWQTFMKKIPLISNI